MAVMKLQLNTPVEITRDLRVEVTDKVTNRAVEVAPNLDGTVSVRSLSPGAHRVIVRHPNISFPIADRQVNLFPKRPTFVPIKIDLSIFENTPVRDIAEADLAPVQLQLTLAGEAADSHTTKRGGEPIYADDWNSLAGTVGGLAEATLELTGRVSPIGHDHPELIEKIDEMQRNFERFLDVFGKSMAQVQRQLQALALQQRTGRALDKIPDVTASTRADFEKIVHTLDDVRTDNPYVYSKRLKRVGEQIEERLFEVLPADAPELIADVDVAELVASSRQMAKLKPTHSYEDEVKGHLAVDAEGGGNFDKVVGEGIGIGL